MSLEKTNGDLGFLRKQLKSFSTIWGQNKIKINIHRIGFSHTDSILVRKLFIPATVQWWWRISFNLRAGLMGQKDSSESESESYETMQI